MQINVALPNKSLSGPQFRFQPVEFLSILGVIVGVVLRWRAIGRESFWYDEGGTWWLISQSPSEILRLLHVDASAPLHLILLHYWAKVFGMSEGALRGFSAMWATGALIVFYMLARRVLGKPVAVAAAVWLFALSSYQVEYSKEARCYALLGFLLLCSLYCLHVFLMERKRWAFVGIVICCAAAMYTHSVAMLYIAALNGLWMLFPSRTPGFRRAMDVLLADLLIGVIYLPWLPIFLGQNKWASAHFAGAVPNVWDAVYVAATQIAGKPFPMGALFASIGMNLLAGPKVVGLVILLAGLAIVAVAASMRNWRSAAVALAVYGAMPLVVAFVRSKTSTPIFIARIFIGSSPIMPLIAAIPLAASMRAGVLRFGARLTTGVLIILSAISVFAIGALQTNENWREVYKHIREQGDEGTLLVFVGNDGEMPFDYYASRDPGSTRLARTGCPHGFFETDPPSFGGRRVKTEADLEPLKKKLQERQWTQIVLVVAHSWWADPDHRVPTYLSSACKLIEDKPFEQIRVMRFAPAADRLSRHAASGLEQ